MESINLEKTRAALETFYKKSADQIDEIYDTRKITTAESLLALIQEEDELLTDLIRTVYHGAKTAALEGLGSKGDNVPYPQLMWARWIGENLERPTFITIQQEVPRLPEDRTPENVPEAVNGSGEKLKGGFIALGGAAVTLGSAVHAIAAAEISLVCGGLLALGIVCTAGGMYLIMKKPEEAPSGRRNQSSGGRSSKEKEAEAVDKILKYQRAANKKQVHDWLAGLMVLIEQGVAADQRREQEEEGG